jgi:hypothetical protein
MLSHINLPEVVKEVTEAFYRYEDALVNNRVDVLDELFWEDSSTVRFGVSENLYGYESIQAFRRSRLPTGLQRTLRATVITTFGEDFAVANTEFTRSGSSKVGRQSQTWVRHSAGWKIVSAHVSLCEV